MKKILLVLLTITSPIIFSQTSDEVEYKKSMLQNGIQSGSIANLDNVTKVNIRYEFKDMVISAKSIGENGHISEENYVNKKADKVEADEKGKGELFKQNWENGKKTEYPTAFETLFNKYAPKDIKMSGTNNGQDANYNLIVRTTKIEPGYKKGMMTVLPYIDIEFVFTDKTGKELVNLFFKAVLPSSVGAPVYAMHKNLAPSYEKAAKKLVEFIEDARKGK